ncbi:MAG: 30S ribosomal protein S7 [Candidatus Altiarchaeum hamiconexum]|uniref:Small ribosomal subunit protein uS7 n=1 Tax=Candidatus Altarchaeum hamiconexum TaxID=1803513 RepID=A0A8J7YRV4_9ARCH|nr:30S ribosomal protein S7 [Candidatus Altarchaeum hamiconexum]OIQ04942.1 MAG: 30S ribosomal protein S7 [Candidatus Altarchaeum sp. CG2_30_32_3053]PIN67100.1 MAG: 30S ribosomal protein S7 [Candidatus Altarchaeum sp. CG12_big_fil_rev_8_21_14_0_65_33_22]PIV27064.1 MAG: 30S ribosomal protein S7 [Candidatus Altarchaeum sp. CG03_land_8_20_14_0_80_32_618]PIX48702.1 MAG: 30S ribosomal protein S7 [Candidatus Altarchaeum sp. CG_4_8_14_3_um_filter_33_2054]PIZ31864.1 MAG: 30S ribosomal protein S7 [Candi
MESDALKLFGRWEYIVEVKDIGLKRYINLNPRYIPITHGKFANKQFGKANVNVVERMANKMMRSGQGAKKMVGKYLRGRGNTGNKLNALNVIKTAFEIIEKRTKKNPIQVLVNALQNTGPAEETTSIIYGGIKYHQAIDASALRRLDFALKNLALGAFATSFNTKNTLGEALANEIVLAANNDTKSFAVSRKEETERIAASSR